MVSTKTDYLKQSKYLSLFLCHYLKTGYCENQDDAAKPACCLCLIFICQILNILFFILLSLMGLN